MSDDKTDGFTPAFDALFEEYGLNPSEALTYGVIWRFSRRRHGKCYASAETIGRHLNASRATVMRALHKLKILDLIEDITPPDRRYGVRVYRAKPLCEHSVSNCNTMSSFEDAEDIVYQNETGVYQNDTGVYQNETLYCVSKCDTRILKDTVKGEHTQDTKCLSQTSQSDVCAAPSAQPPPPHIPEEASAFEIMKLLGASDAIAKKTAQRYPHDHIRALAVQAVTEQVEGPLGWVLYRLVAGAAEPVSAGNGKGE